MTSFLSGLIHLRRGQWDVWRSGATGDRGGGKICPCRRGPYRNDYQGQGRTCHIHLRKQSGRA